MFGGVGREKFFSWARHENTLSKNGSAMRGEKKFPGHGAFMREKKFPGHGAFMREKKFPGHGTKYSVEKWVCHAGRKKISWARHVHFHAGECVFFKRKIGV
jgi:hypothetical protein